MIRRRPQVARCLTQDWWLHNLEPIQYQLRLDMDRYQSFGDRTDIDVVAHRWGLVVGRQRGEGGGGDVEGGDVEEGEGETRPLLVQQHPALPVLLRCLTSPWSQT